MLGEDHHLLIEIGPDKVGHRRARRLQDMGAQLALESGAPMNARIPLCKAMHGITHNRQWWRAGGVVQVDVPTQAAVENGYTLIAARDLAGPPRR